MLTAMSDSAVMGSEQEIRSEMEPVKQQGSLDMDLDSMTIYICTTPDQTEEEFWGFGLVQRTLESSDGEKMSEDLLLCSDNS